MQSGADQNKDLNSTSNRAGSDLKKYQDKDGQKSAAKNDDQLNIPNDAGDGPAEAQLESARKRKSPRIASKQPKLNAAFGGGASGAGAAALCMTTAEQAAQIRSTAISYVAQEGVDPVEWTQ